MTAIAITDDTPITYKPAQTVGELAAEGRADFRRAGNIEEAARAMLAALQQIVVLSEYGTTGPGSCLSDKLTAEQATSLRKALSDISRDAIAQAQAAGIGSAA